jgi:hypothetical protein
MEKRISIEERVADLERELAALKLSIDEQPARDAWLNDIEAEVPQRVFRVLITYLSVVPGFSANELRSLTERVLLTFPTVAPEARFIREHMERRTRAIIDEMLPAAANEP